MPDPNEKVQTEGEVLSEMDYDALAEITPEDIQQALQDFDKSVPDTFKGMLDADA